MAKFEIMRKERSAVTEQFIVDVSAHHESKTFSTDDAIDIFKENPDVSMIALQYNVFRNREGYDPLYTNVAFFHRSDFELGE